MRRKRLRRYVDRLKALQGQTLTRDQMLMKLGAAKHEAGRAASLVKLTISKDDAPRPKTKRKSSTPAPTAAAAAAPTTAAAPTEHRRRRQLQSWNSGSTAPSCVWCADVKGAICCAPISPRTSPISSGASTSSSPRSGRPTKELKHDLSVRPIYHRIEPRIEAHIFVAFLAYCLQVTLKARLRIAARGITPREVIAKFKTIQMVDVHVPTTDGRELVLSRYTQPEADHRMLLEQLRLTLPEQPPPRITAASIPKDPLPTMAV